MTHLSPGGEEDKQWWRRGQTFVNICLRSLCERESFWYSYVLEWTMVEKKSKSKSKDRELRVWRRKKEEK